MGCSIQQHCLFHGLVEFPFHTINAEAKDFVAVPGGLLPGGPAFDRTSWGNVVAVAKVVLWEDRPAGDLLSAGMVASQLRSIAR